MWDFPWIIPKSLIINLMIQFLKIVNKSSIVVHKFFCSIGWLNFLSFAVLSHYRAQDHDNAFVGQWVSFGFYRVFAVGLKILIFFWGVLFLFLFVLFPLMILFLIFTIYAKLTVGYELIFLWVISSFWLALTTRFDSENFFPSTIFLKLQFSLPTQSFAHSA